VTGDLNVTGGVNGDRGGGGCGGCGHGSGSFARRDGGLCLVFGWGLFGGVNENFKIASFEDSDGEAGEVPGSFVNRVPWVFEVDDNNKAAVVPAGRVDAVKGLDHLATAPALGTGPGLKSPGGCITLASVNKGFGHGGHGHFLNASPKGICRALGGLGLGLGGAEELINFSIGCVSDIVKGDGFFGVHNVILFVLGLCLHNKDQKSVCQYKNTNKQKKQFKHP